MGIASQPVSYPKEARLFCNNEENSKNADRERGEYGPHFCVEGFTYLEGGVTREYSVMLSYRAIL